MIEKLFAIVVIAGCVFLLVRLLLRPSARWRFDAFSRGAWRRSQRAGERVIQALRRAGTHIVRLSRQRASRRAAAAAIERARRKPAGEWEGNVYKPTSFQNRDRDRDKLH